MARRPRLLRQAAATGGRPVHPLYQLELRPDKCRVLTSVRLDANYRDLVVACLERGLSMIMTDQLMLLGGCLSHNAKHTVKADHANGIVASFQDGMLKSLQHGDLRSQTASLLLSKARCHEAVLPCSHRPARVNCSAPPRWHSRVPS